MRPLAPPIPWTPNLVDRLRRYWPDSSATWIAKELGYPGRRNSIIGKARRLGLHKKTRPTETGERSPTAKLGRQVVRVARVRAFRESVVSVPVCCDPVPYFQTTWRNCRWLVSPPGVPMTRMLVCGAPRLDGSSWCEHHHGIAFRPRRTGP